MAYEDPNAPSPATSGYAQQSTSPVDQSKTFLGGQHHPWRRLFARTVDICTAGFVLFLLLIFAFGATMPEQAAGFAKAIENPIIASVVLYLIWLPAEALLLSLFGTTPAKWLFGIRVAHPAATC
jgi:fumarate reductase subunit C